MSYKTVYRNLRVELTDHDRTTRSMRIAELEADKETLEKDAKNIAEILRGRAFMLGQRISRLQTSVGAGADEKLVECRWVYAGRIKKLVRIDTDEIIEIVPVNLMIDATKRG